MQYTFYTIWNPYGITECFSTKSEALARCNELRETYPEVVVEKVKTGKITKELIMYMISSNGGGWCAESEEIE